MNGFDIGETVTVKVDIPTKVTSGGTIIDIEEPTRILLSHVSGESGEVVSYCTCGCGWPMITFFDTSRHGSYPIPFEALEAKHNQLAWPENET